jgi:hypothetical protein
LLPILIFPFHFKSLLCFHFFVSFHFFSLTSFVFSLDKTKETVSADGSTYIWVYKKVLTQVEEWREKSTFPLDTTRRLQYWFYQKQNI